MKAKSVERLAARKLRKRGYSLKEIVRELGAAKSSVSVWVRDIKLTEKQRQILTSRHGDRSLIERRRQTRLKNELAKRTDVINAAATEISQLSNKELWLVGTMLYWAEGGKTQSVVRFANGDPEMIKIMMVFFKKICKVADDKFRGYLHIHPHLDYKAAEKHWSEVSGIPLKHFYKTYRKMNISSKNQRDSLPMGTFDIYVSDAKLLYTITGWAKGIFSNY